LDVIGTKVLRVFLLAIHSHLYKRILLPAPPWSKVVETGLYNVYGNLKSEISQDYIQKPQRNCTFMNSASVYASQRWAVHTQIASPQFCGRKYCVRFADLSQMWQSADFRFANSIFFMISRYVLYLLAICRPKIFRFKRKRLLNFTSNFLLCFQIVYAFCIFVSSLQIFAVYLRCKQAKNPPFSLSSKTIFASEPKPNSAP
jgi:hypothetical protein